MRVKNNQDFYRALHALEEDPKWFTHVGQESGLDQYIDDGDPQTDVKTVLEDRKRLKKVRKMLQVNPQAWRTGSKRDTVRLVVTYYARFGLSYKDMSGILHIPVSTLRHGYPPFKENEVINSDLRVELRDKFGKHVQL